MGEDREAGGRRAGSGREKGEIPLIADPARRPPAFPTDPEPVANNILLMPNDAILT